METKEYPIKCNKCSQPLYGPVSYCPFCGEAAVSVTAADDKQNLNTLKDEIYGLLSKGAYAPDIRGDIRQKGQAVGIDKAAADSLLLSVLKEKGFSPLKEGATDPLAVDWYTAETKPKEVTPPPQTETPIIEESPPKREEEKPVGTVAEQQEKTSALANLTIKSKPSGVAVFLNGDRKGNSPLTINNIEKGSHIVRLEYAGFKTKEEHVTLGHENQILGVNLEKEKPRPKYWIAAAVISLIMAGFFYSKNGPHDGKEIPPEPPIINSAPALTPGGGAVRPPAPIVEPEIRNLNAVVLDANDRPIASFVPGQTIKLTSDYEISASPDTNAVTVEENNYLVMPDGNKTPDAIRTKQRGTGSYKTGVSITMPDKLLPGIYTYVVTIKIGDKISKSTQPITVASVPPDQTDKQREIDEYLADGRRFFENGKYELCIEKMREVIKRDSNNSEAKQYIRMASEKINNIKKQFSNPTFGGSE